MNFEEIQRLADEYFEQNQLQSAVRLYKQCIQQNFLSYQQIQGLGNIQDQKGYYQGRLGQWYNDLKKRNLLKGSPIQALSLIFSGSSYIHFAKDYLLSLLDRFPKNYQIVLTLGHVQSNLRNYRKAQIFYQQAIQTNPEIQHGYYALASLYFYEFNDELKARQFSIKTLYCNKQNILAKIIFIYTSATHYQTKIVNLMEIYQKQTLMASKINNLIGCLLYQNELYDRSKQYFQQSMEVNSRYISPYIGLATIYMKFGQYNEAQRYLFEGLKLDPSCIQVLNGLGNVSIFTGQYQKSIQWFYASSECNQKHFQSYYGIGNSYYLQQDYQSAIDWFQQAVQRDSNRYEIYQSLGNCFLNIEDYQNSLQQYFKCFEINSSFDILYEIIKILIKCQRYQDCSNYIQSNLDIVKEKPQIIYFLLAYCYVMLSQFKKAQEIYKISLEQTQFQQFKYCLNAIQLIKENYQ